jgi:hypothetical protein
MRTCIVLAASFSGVDLEPDWADPGSLLPSRTLPRLMAVRQPTSPSSAHPSTLGCEAKLSSEELRCARSRLLKHCLQLG